MKKIENKANEIIHTFELATWGEITWKDVLKLLSEALPGTVSHMIHHSPDNKKSLSLNWYGIEDIIAKNYEGYFISIDPWADIISKSNHGETLSSEEILSALTLKNTEYYCDHLYMMGNTVAWTGMKVNTSERNNVFLCIHYDYDKYNSYGDSFNYLLKLIKNPFLDAVRNTAKINKLLKKILRNFFHLCLRMNLA